MIRGLDPRRILILVSLLFFGPVALTGGAAGATELPAGTEIRYHPAEATLAVSVPSAPLQDVLEAVTEKTGVVFVLPPSMNPTVTRYFESLPMDRAIKQLLGSSVNAAMIYIKNPDGQGRDRVILKEVQILGGVIPAVSGTPNPVSINTPSPAAPSSPLPQLSPEELAARRAEREAKRAEREKIRAERRAGRRGGAEVQPPAPPAQAPNQDTKVDQPAPAAPTPSAPSVGSGAQGRPSRRGR